MAPAQRVVVVDPMNQMRRRIRRPVHTFQVRHQPWEIQPFMIAPVLPGDTLENLLVQSRAVSKPIKNPLIGWWLEHYFFYVKIRDLDDRDTYTAMMTTLGTTLSGVAATIPGKYVAKGTYDWVTPCLKRITEEFFRQEGENFLQWSTGSSPDKTPLAQIKKDDWLDSLQLESMMPAAVDATVDTTGDDFTIREFEEKKREYELAQQLGLMSEITYEEWLATYGIKQNPEELHKPEMIRSLTSWSLPASHVEPSTGVPSSALSWKIAERADKKRFFKEHGFIVGVTLARPKVYLGKVAGNATGLLRNTLQWLPAVLRSDSAASLLRIENSSGLLTDFPNDNTKPVFVDVADLYNYGDQFVNFALSETDAGFVALPQDDVNKMYPSQSDIDALFVGSVKTIAQDGIVSLAIATMAPVDATPRTPSTD